MMLIRKSLLLAFWKYNHLNYIQERKQNFGHYRENLISKFSYGRKTISIFHQERKHCFYTSWQEREKHRYHCRIYWLFPTTYSIQGHECMGNHTCMGYFPQVFTIFLHCLIFLDKLCIPMNTIILYLYHAGSNLTEKMY